MGKTHVFGFAIAEKVFDLPITFAMDTIADVSLAQAQQAQRAFGFARATGNWRDLIADADIDLVDITAPNALHKDIAFAAIRAGKHVYCEKPLALCRQDAQAMTEAAEAAAIKTQVGFNYLVNPMFCLARDIIHAGELGEIYAYRGVHAEDYMSDPNTVFGFRHQVDGGGALADIGSHALATAEFLLGEIKSVMGHCRTLIPVRYDAQGKQRTIEVDDVTHVVLDFACGATGTVEANWCATGRTMQHDFSVYGSKGALHFSQERLNELHIFDMSDQPGRRGFRRIEASPAHAPYGEFCVAAGHQLGFNDLKAIEIAGFARALAGEAKELFNFRAGWRIQGLVDAVQESHQQQCWVNTTDFCPNLQTQ